MGDDHETPSETESVAGAGHGTFVGQMFRDLLEPAPDEPIEWLQKEDGFTEPVEKLPCRITASQVRQLVREEALLMFYGEIFDPFGTADLRLFDACGKGYCDGRGRAQTNRFPQTHGGGKAVEEPPSWDESVLS